MLSHWPPCLPTPSCQETGHFTVPTIEALAARCNYRCSNPDCRIPTTIPLRSPDRYANIGEAAHIKGRRAKSARYDPQQDSADRSTASNGIHLCCNCHKLVDTSGTDEFSVEMLLQWKKDAEGVVIQRFYKTHNNPSFDQN
uniref:HNH nuclease domain-containing protein n=1 Tax=Chlamydomonas euryale TaxID=1486919 RepID=A0A7R9VAC7_9CHLO|mmetsp:Transcript_28549/g.84517  ORF Transcript_28549/g.84517 Transcript_28549/m.84517 type:complete len:141 (+) Transcript_28549:332-754(+)|eukprot:355977-Chlamydomonas_euryale.AAC.2